LSNGTNPERADEDLPPHPLWRREEGMEELLIKDLQKALKALKKFGEIATSKEASR
jgi:hypothetical protein